VEAQLLVQRIPLKNIDFFHLARLKVRKQDVFNERRAKTPAVRKGKFSKGLKSPIRVRGNEDLDPEGEGPRKRTIGPLDILPSALEDT